MRYIHGFHAVLARLRQRPDSVREIYLVRSDRRAEQLRQAALDKSVRVMDVDAQRLDGIAGHTKHQGVAARVDETTLARSIDEVLDELEDAKEPALLLLLDGVQDPHNLGACLRVADAAGVHAVIAPKDRAVGITATVAKVASGAAESIPYLMVTNLARTMREVQQRGVWLLGADEAGEASLYSAKLSGALGWVLGAEGAGLRRLTRETCDALVRIPMFGSVESLNVSVASGICLFETRRQREQTQGNAVER